MKGILTAYLPGIRRRPVFEPEQYCGETVILVHGLLHRSWRMMDLGQWLCRKGYRVYVYDYPTSRRLIPEMGRELAGFLRQVAAKEAPENRISLISHSMGGLLLRCALAQPEIVPAERRGRWIMLGTPNGGSPVARKVIRDLFFAPALVRPLTALSRPATDLPVPEDWEVHVVAGAFDRKVPPRSAHYPAEKTYYLAQCAHSLMMNHPEVRDRIAGIFMEKEKICK